MKLASAIEGGLAGATTISLLGETLRKIEGQTSGFNVLNGKGLKKRFKKAKSKKKGKSAKEFIGLAGDVLSSASFLGLPLPGKKKNALWRGAILGAAAGLGAVLLKESKDKKYDTYDSAGHPSSMLAKDPLLSKAIEVGLYTAGGMIAAKLIQKAGAKKKRKKK